MPLFKDYILQHPEYINVSDISVYDVRTKWNTRIITFDENAFGYYDSDLILI